jgi:eukaryotic-like serine/threonine-protein kinase
VTTPAERLTAALVGHYQIEREIGEGGMATVYLAHDLRHQRKVALKVLRPELSAILGGERFLHEIRTTANLQHPHILPLHDSGEADGIVYYVMPFVQGESLRARLQREKQLPVEDAVRIAREVADALDYAHRHGIVHRDIKPENILLHDGRAQVADFGIALAVSSAGGGTRMTETGMSLGTPNYMSPEQAMGERDISAKSDIYALGCVLYEMLAGEPPFTGPTAQAIIARVVTEEPRSLVVQRRTIPPHVDAVVRKALEKLPADRFSSAAQFATALTNADLAPATAARGRPEPPVAAAPGTRARLFAMPLVPAALLTLLVLTSVGGAWGWLRSDAFVPQPVVRFNLSLPDNARFVDEIATSIALSSDGTRMVYVGANEQSERQLYMRTLDQLEPVAIAGTRAAVQPFLSPDGQWVGFHTTGKLQKVAVAGGPALTIAATDSGVFGVSWGEGDVILFGTLRGIRRVPAAGGVPAHVTTPDSATELAHGFPHVLPGGKAALFQLRGTDNVDRVAVVTLRDGKVKRFDQAGTDPRYVRSGHVVLGSLDGTVVAVPFNLRKLEFTGPAVPVAERVIVGGIGAMELGLSAGGSFVYASGASGIRSLAHVGRNGVAQALSTEMRAYASPRFSPDGRLIAMEIAEGRGSAVWVFDIAQKTLTRLTFESDAVRPVWSPDGRYLIYTVAGGDPDIYRIRADGSALAETLLVAPGRQLADDISPDGRYLVYHQNNAASTRNDIMLLSMDGTGAIRPYLQTPADEFAPAVAPNGRWLAYSSDESGRVEVYVRAFPEAGAKIQVSLDGGTEPRWSRDGRRLYYRNGDRMLAATVVSEAEFAVQQRTELFRGVYLDNRYHTQYDVARDGSLVMTQGSQTSNDVITVLNWFDQFRGRRMTPGGTAR